MWIKRNHGIKPYIGMSTNPKLRFSSHKWHSNNHKEGENYNCGLSEFLIKEYGGWVDNSLLQFMIIDSVEEDEVPENLGEKEKSLWIYKKLEGKEEIWRNRLHTYIPIGLNKRGENNFRKLVLPKINKMIETTQPLPKIKKCEVRLKRLSLPSIFYDSGIYNMESTESVIPELQ